MVMADGFAWNGRTYDSLSKVAFAITGTKWNGPRFFGLRDREDRSTMAGWALIRSRYDDGGCIGVEIARCGQAEMNRVARSLKALGLVRKQRRTGDERTWIYSAPVTNDGSEPPSGSVTTLRLVTARRPVTQETPAAQP
jgi:hypothetical protein